GVGLVLRPRRQQLLDLPLQGGRAAFVGVVDEDPVVGHLVHRPVLLRRRAKVGALEEADLVVAAADLGRAGGREGVDHQDLVAPEERFDAGGDVRLLVEGGDDRRHGGSGRRGFGSRGHTDLLGVLRTRNRGASLSEGLLESRRIWNTGLREVLCARTSFSWYCWW